MKNLEEFSRKNLGEEVVKIIEMIKSTVSQPDNDSKLQNLTAQQTVLDQLFFSKKSIFKSLINSDGSTSNA